MFQSQLIYAGSLAERKKVAREIIHEALGIKASPNHPDLIILEAENSLGISQIRSLQKQLQLKPYQAPNKAALITQAEKLTIAAQNALLKTLEEPPAQTLIILLAAQKEALLPTIISRCQIIALTQKTQIETNEKQILEAARLAASIIKSRPGKRVELAQSYRFRPQALAEAENLLVYWRQLLLTKAGSLRGKDPLSSALSYRQIISAIQKTETARIMIESNINPLLAVENLFLNYPFC